MQDYGNFDWPPNRLAYKSLSHPPKRRVCLSNRICLYVRNIFSAIGEFFRKKFSTNYEGILKYSEIATFKRIKFSEAFTLHKKLDILTKNKRVSSKGWNDLIKFYFTTKSKHLSANAVYNYDKKEFLVNFESKIRFEIMRFIQNNPSAKTALDPCLAKLGKVPAMQPALLSNNANSCYLDSLLQILFASKEFIKLLDACNPELADPTDKRAVAYKPVIVAFKEYCIGLKAACVKEEINKLRDKIRTALEGLPKEMGFKKGTVRSEQDADELVKIIFDALKLKGTHTFNTKVTKIFDLNRYELVKENPEDFSLVLNIPKGQEQELTSDQHKKASEVQSHFFRFMLAYNEMVKENNLFGRENWRDIAKELQNKINEQQLPRLSLQMILDEITQEKRDSTDEPNRTALENYDATFVGKTMAEIRQTISPNVLKDALTYYEKTELAGDAPPILCLSLIRETGIKGLNNQKIEIPQNEVVGITISGQKVEYRVVGIAGGSISQSGGHWVANAKVEGQWYNIDDRESKATSIHSGNTNLTTDSRLYMLEKV